jgi:hypothetical protein
MKTLFGKSSLLAVVMAVHGVNPAQVVAQVVQTASFTGAEGEDFSVDENWSTGMVPGLRNVVAIADKFTVTLTANYRVQRLALGNDATLSILSGGSLVVGAGWVWVGFTGANEITGTGGTATLNLEAGGELSATENLYIASGNPNGRSGVLNLNGGTVSVADRFWVGTGLGFGAVADSVVGTLNINGSAINWANRVADMNLGGGNGRAVIKFTLDGGGVTTLTTQDLVLGGGKASLTVDFSAHTVVTDQVFELISYSGVLEGTFDTVSFTGLGAGQTASIDYGSGTNGVVRVAVVAGDRSSRAPATGDPNRSGGDRAMPWQGAATGHDLANATQTLP